MTTAIDNKKTQRDEASSSIDVTDVNKNKRQKIDTANGEVPKAGMGAKELASAFALASLASFSRSESFADPTPLQVEESREVEDGRSSSFEGRHSKDESARSNLDGTSSSKRVHFAPNIKNAQRLTSRKLSYPPRINQSSSSRPTPPVHVPRGVVNVYQRNDYTPAWPPTRVQHSHAMNYAPQPPPPYTTTRYRYSPTARPPTYAAHPPPPSHATNYSDHEYSLECASPQQHHKYSASSPPPQSREHESPTKEWICDYCNVESFSTFQEACIHETSCKLRCNTAPRRHPMWQPLPVNTHNYHHSAPHHHETIMYSHSMESEASSRYSVPVYHHHNERKWPHSSHHQPAHKRSHSEWLFAQNCFVRDVCIEVFAASEADTEQYPRASVGQAGIRCRFCVRRHYKEQASAAASFPSSLNDVCESVKLWYHNHLDVCSDVPQSARMRLAHLNTPNVWTSATRQYWTDTSISLGMIETSEGLRFASSGYSRIEANTENRDEESRQSSASTVDSGDTKDASRECKVLQDGDSIVLPEDIVKVPPYVHFLLSQVEVCHFTEADRFVARSKGPVGFPGFQCSHCNGHAGLGKYFPVTSKSFSTNSTSQNIHAHLLKCRKCPQEVKDRLLTLKEEKSKAPRLEPGWRRVYFDKLWIRYHGSPSSS